MHAGWSAGARAEPHNHGGASGAVLVLYGHFVETTWQLAGGTLAPLAQHRHGPGSVMTVGPGLIHALDARTEGATLHVYAPPVSRMRVYDRAAQQVLELSDEHGAWLPNDARHVLARCSFEEACDGRR